MQCNIELEIVELKNFIGQWIDIFSRRFDEQDRTLSIILDAMKAANFGPNLPIVDVCKTNEISSESANSVAENGDLKIITVSYPQTETLDNKPSNVSRLVICENNCCNINDQILSNTAGGDQKSTESFGQSAIRVLEPEQPVKQEDYDDFAANVENIDNSSCASAATPYDHSCTDIPRNDNQSNDNHSSVSSLCTDDDDSYQDDSQSGTSSDNDSSLFYNNTFLNPSSPSADDNRPIIYNSKGSQLAKNKCVETVLKGVIETSRTNCVKQHAATELRRAYLSRLSKFRHQPQTSSTNQNNDNVTTPVGSSATNEMSSLRQVSLDCRRLLFLCCVLKNCLFSCINQL